MRWILIIILIITCVFFLFEPLIEKYEGAASSSPDNCIMKYKGIFEARNKKNPEKLAKQLCNSGCIDNPTGPNCVGQCKTINTDLFSGDVLEKDCAKGHFKCHCPCESGKGWKEGITKNTYDNECGHLTDGGKWEAKCDNSCILPDNYIYTGENSTWNALFPYPTSQ